MEETPTKFQDYMALVKPRLAALALLMTAFGFYLGWNVYQIPNPFILFSITMLGATLIGAGSGALNQYIERDVDKLMKRTQNRPLPSGRLTEREVLVFGWSTSILGCLTLYLFVNPLTALLGALILFLYLGPYTFLKQKSSISTLIGAIPGALPALMGWTASFGAINEQGIALFLILFVWQMPHFFAIAWIYKKEYAKANMPMLPVIDKYYGMTSRQSVLYTLILIPVTLLPTVWNLSGGWYSLGAIVLGVGFLALVVKLYFHREISEARKVFRFSIIYLPLLLILMVWDKVS